ncbi:MAG: hypothetical protein KDC84_06965 [Crocinitomicaceae bacterium]|nr:hypothetical protein [Crocinitomicaceae bacterium]
MKQFYSLIYVKPNVLTDELILVGMIAGIQNTPYFFLSEVRMRLAKKSLKVSQFESLKNSMMLIHGEIEDLSRMPESLPLFDHPYSYEILQKTSIFKKNLLVYSNPSEIVEQGKIEINKLVKVIFNEKYQSFQEDKKEPGFRSKWINNQKLTEHNLRRKLTLSPDQIQTIFFPHQIDLIGVYGNRFVTFHGLDLHSAPRTVEKNIFEFSRLVRGLEEYANAREMGKGDHFLVVESPRSPFAKDLIAKLDANTNTAFKFVKLSDFQKVVSALSLNESNQVVEIFQ